MTASSSRNTEPLIVVSGASGFVGRRLAVRVAEVYPSAKLICYATRNDSTYEYQGKKALASKNIRAIETDLTTGSGLIKLPEQPSVVFHLAANSATWSKDQSCNDLGTQNFLSSIRHLGPGTHVVFTSTIAVMDTRGDYSVPLTETTPTCRRPFTDYGLSKLRAEEWLQHEARARGFALSILRPVTVYGPECRPNTVQSVLKREVLRRSLLSRMQWPGKTGFIHVADLAEVLVAIGELPPSSGHTETYLVQAETRSLADVSRSIHSALNVPFRPMKLPERFWRPVRRMCNLALHLKWSVPCSVYATWWRLRVACENVFWCDTAKLRAALPRWRPLSLDDRIRECL
jgi:nucleoside-diphosphate-sugar epimerase